MHTLGTAVRDLESPDRILIGGNLKDEDGTAAVEKLVDIYSHWVSVGNVYVGVLQCIE
jgi:UDP-glucose 6-dehydrogenase